MSMPQFFLWYMHVITAVLKSFSEEVGHGLPVELLVKSALKNFEVTIFTAP